MVFNQIYLERVNKIGLNLNWRIELYKCLLAPEIFPKEAEERAMKAKLRVKAKA